MVSETLTRPMHAAAVQGNRDVVRTRQLTKVYGDNVVLGGVDFSVAQGEFVALLGPSGTGKTTLLRIIAGLEDASSGQCDVLGRSALVFQDPRLILAQRVWRNVALQDDRTPGSRERVQASLAEVGLSDKADVWPSSLSGGQAQRVGIARALYTSPDLLLLDEPFSALDTFTRRKVQDLVLDLWQSHRPGVLLVTHDIEEAILLADRVVILGKGFVKADIPIALERKRDPTDPAFNAIKREILGHFADAF